MSVKAATETAQPKGTAKITETIRIKHTDGQGHASYKKGFGAIMQGATETALEKSGLEKTKALVIHRSTQYKAQMHMGSFVTGLASISVPNPGLLAITTSLIVAGAKKPAAQGYIAAIADSNIGSGIDSDDTYWPSVNGYQVPYNIPPSRIIGHEIPLSEYERTIRVGMINSNGMVNNNDLFDLLHTYAYEKGVTEGTGESFADKNGKPVMADSSVIIYRPLKAGEQFRVFVSTKIDEKRPYRYNWQGTITDMEGNIIAIATCNHALLTNDDKPKDLKDIDPRFIEKLKTLSVDAQYTDLFNTGGIYPFNTNITTRDNNGFVTATITVADERMNVVTAKFLSELNGIVSGNNNRALVMQSGTDGVFVAGARVPDFAGKSAEEVQEFSKRAQDSFNILATHPNATAVINGYALGGGCELAMACKYRLATADAKIGQVEAKIGAIAAFDGHQRLTQLVGLETAAKLLVSGEMICAEKALKIGLVDMIISTNSEIANFAKSHIHCTYNRRAPMPSVKSTKDVLDDIQRKTERTFSEHKNKLSTLQERGQVTEQQAQNISKWLDGVHQARLATVAVLREQAQANTPEEKSKIERDAFERVTATESSKFATDFYLLNKKQYAEEHKIIQEHGLDKSGTELSLQTGLAK